MTTTALVLALAAVLLALVVNSRVARQARRIEDLEAEVRRRAITASEETDAKLGLLRKLLARVVEGKTVTPDMIHEERLWQDIMPDAGRELAERSNVVVIDVRTPQETSGGVIEGAILIPVGELEERSGEIPKDDRQKLLVCAGGGRSAAACEYLSSEGFEELYNLAGGMSAWTGKTVPPSSE